VRAPSRKMRASSSAHISAPSHRPRAFLDINWKGLIGKRRTCTSSRKASRCDRRDSAPNKQRLRSIIAPSWIAAASPGVAMLRYRSSMPIFRSTSNKRPPARSVVAACHRVTRTTSTLGSSGRTCCSRKVLGERALCRIRGSVTSGPVLARAAVDKRSGVIVG
jgi:hypothetical protein